MTTEELQRFAYLASIFGYKPKMNWESEVEFLYRVRRWMVSEKDEKILAEIDAILERITIQK